MFPAISDAWRTFKAGLGSQPEPLNLKSGPSAAFDTVNVDWYMRNGYPGIARALSGGSPGWAGESVNADTALNHSVVWACNRIISESVGFLPLLMMQDNGNGKAPATPKPMYQALHNAPNDEMTTMEFRETLTSHCVLGGNAYGQIMRRSGTGVANEIYPLMPSQMMVDRDKSKKLIYIVKEKNQPDKTYTVMPGKPQDILHIRGLGSNGITGYSVITMARQSLGTAQAGERFAGTFYKNGGRVPYYLSLDQKFKTDQDGDKFCADWERIYSQPHKAPILEPGMHYNQIGMSNADAQFLETRQFNIPEICRWFLVSPHLVGDLSRATFSNIEHLALEFVKMTLTAWLTRWEQDLWRCVLTTDEKGQGYYFKHNVNALLRGDFVSRMQGYASALQNGHLNIDEVRDLEDRNPLPSGAGEAYHVQLNMGTVPGTGDPLTAERQATGLVQISPRPPAKALSEVKAAPVPAPLPPVFNLQIQQPNIEVNVPPTQFAAPTQKMPEVVYVKPVKGKLALKRDKNGLVQSIESVDGKTATIKRDDKGRLVGLETDREVTLNGR